MRRNKCKKSSSSINVSYIPEEILIDILVRLPVKSLIRFRWVSKSWCGLIGSRSFLITHLNRNVTKLSHTYLIALQRSRDKPSLCHSLFSTETFEECLKLKHPLWTEEQFRIYGSSNGVVCISDQVLPPSSPICIWNPCIRKFRILPPSKFKSNYCSYDISLSFGFHPELNDYRVVTMGWYVRSFIKVQVYSVSTGSWKMIEVIPAWLKFNPDWCQGCAFFNGVAYWLFMKSKKFRFVSFDTDSEEFEELVVPDAISTKGYTYVGVYNDSVCLFYSYLEGPECQKPEKYMDIWVLKQRSFTKLPTAILLPGRDYLPLGFSIQNELIAKDKKQTKGDEGDTGQMVLYDLEMKLIKKTGISLAHDSHYKTSAVRSNVSLGSYEKINFGTQSAWRLDIPQGNLLQNIQFPYSVLGDWIWSIRSMYLSFCLGNVILEEMYPQDAHSKCKEYNESLLCLLQWKLSEELVE